MDFDGAGLKLFSIKGIPISEDPLFPKLIEIQFLAMGSVEARGLFDTWASLEDISFSDVCIIQL